MTRHNGSTWPMMKAEYHLWMVPASASDAMSNTPGVAYLADLRTLVGNSDSDVVSALAEVAAVVCRVETRHVVGPDKANLRNAIRARMAIFEVLDGEGWNNGRAARASAVDRTTVHLALTRTPGLLQSDPQFAALVRAVRSALRVTDTPPP